MFKGSTPASHTKVISNLYSATPLSEGSSLGWWSTSSSMTFLEEGIDPKTKNSASKHRWPHNVATIVMRMLAPKAGFHPCSSWHTHIPNAAYGLLFHTVPEIMVWALIQFLWWSSTPTQSGLLDPPNSILVGRLFGPLHKVEVVVDARSVIVYKALGCKLGTFDSSESLSRLELKFLHGTMEKNGFRWKEPVIASRSSSRIVQLISIDLKNAGIWVRFWHVLICVVMLSGQGLLQCFSLQSASHQISKLHDYTSWWFQPIRKICSSNWIISPSSECFFSKICELTTPRLMLSICLLNLSKSFETAISFFQGWHHGTHGMGSMGWDLIYLLSWGPNMAGWKMDPAWRCTVDGSEIRQTHQLRHYLQFFFTSKRWCRISEPTTVCPIENRDLSLSC